jgi:hypothetical protein
MHFGPREKPITFNQAGASGYFDRTVSADLPALYDDFLSAYRRVGPFSMPAIQIFRPSGSEAEGGDAFERSRQAPAEFSGATCLPMWLEDSGFNRRL